MLWKENIMPRLNVDFSGVEERKTVPEGNYICKVKKVEAKTSESSGSRYLKWTLTIGVGEYKNNNLYHITSLKPQALFNLRNTLIACGIDVPLSAINVDTDKLPGKILGVTVYHEEYNGKPSAKIKDTWAAIKTEQGWQKKTAAAVAAMEKPPEPDPVDELDDLDL